MMEIEVKVATILLKKAEPHLRSTDFSLTVEDGTTVHQLIDIIGMPHKLVGSVTVNKRRQGLDTVINPSDKVAIIPAISGG